MLRGTSQHKTSPWVTLIPGGFLFRLRTIRWAVAALPESHGDTGHVQRYGHDAGRDGPAVRLLLFFPYPCPLGRDPCPGGLSLPRTGPTNRRAPELATNARTRYHLRCRAHAARYSSKEQLPRRGARLWRGFFLKAARCARSSLKNGGKVSRHKGKGGNQ
jgi:hypothetical protein